MEGWRSFAVTVLAAVCVLLPLPAAAHAADAYVDFETGDDTLPCGPIGDPCKVIPTGIAQATAGATVRVDDRPGTASYASGSTIILGDGKSLVAEEFVGGDEGSLSDPDTIIDGGSIIGGAVILVQAGNPAGTIQGFRIRAGAMNLPIALLAPATLIGNVIDEDAAAGGCLVQVQNSGNTATIGPGNTFVDPTPTPTTPETGICVTNSAAPSIVANAFTDLNQGVTNAGGNSTISFNSFTGTRAVNSFDAAIAVTSGAALTITGNLIESPGDANVGGIRLEQTGASPDVGATLRQNSVLSHRTGIAVINTEPLVIMIGNLIAKSGGSGLGINDSDGDSDAGVIATNMTVVDSIGANVAMFGADLFLNSSIIGSPGITTFDMTSNCTISFSRGPSIAPGGTGCAEFDTTAAPGFVDPDVDYHLAAGSPMIDMGEPNPPGDLDLDIDGESRVTDGNGDGIARRDIGADETATLVLPPPVTPTPAAPGIPAQSKQKRCKKKRKKRAAPAKKKGCKRKRKT